MKLLYAVVLLFLVAYRVTDGQFKFKRCEDSDDCGHNRCCVRSTPKMPWVPEITKCKSMAKLGRKCNPDPDNDGVFQFTCPCGEGMECVDVSGDSSDSSSSSSSSSSEEEDYRCVAAATPTPEEEVTATETGTEVVAEEATEAEKMEHPEEVPTDNEV
nr:hypothetical protein F6W77_19550 [Acinetobacter baumannii]